MAAVAVNLGEAGSSSSVATDVKDLQFDFSSSSDNTGGASGTFGKNFNL